jgi:hypothetical protein
MHSDPPGVARHGAEQGSSSEPLSIADYLYFGQLPSLLFTPDAWQEARQRFGGTAEGKQRLRGMDPGKLVMKWKTPTGSFAPSEPVCPCL